MPAAPSGDTRRSLQPVDAVAPFLTQRAFLSQEDRLGDDNDIVRDRLDQLDRATVIGASAAYSVNRPRAARHPTADGVVHWFATRASTANIDVSDVNATDELVPTLVERCKAARPAAP